MNTTTLPPPTAAPSAPRPWALWRVGLLWTLLVLLLAVLAALLLQRNYREQTQSVAAARLGAVKDTVTVSFRQWAALPTSLARRQVFSDFLAHTPRLELDKLTSAQQQERYDAFQKDPTVDRINHEVTSIAAEFELPYLALIAADGLVVASTAVFGGRRPSNLRTREYFSAAMQNGKGAQFLLGRVSSAAGMYFASRVERGGQAVGVIVVKQNADVINRLFAESDAHTILLTDPNGVIVLGNRPELLLRRLPTTGELSEQVWIDIYQRVPQALPWRIESAQIGDSSASSVQIMGQRHLVQSAALAGLPLTAWVLAPLNDEPAMHASVAAAALIAWLLGGGLLWFGWRRAYWLESALRAQREVGQLAAARHATEQRFAAVFEHASAAYLFFTPTAGLTHCNPATLRLFGVPSANDLLGRVPWFPPLSPEVQPGGVSSRERALELMTAHLRSGQRVQTCEWRFQRRDGSAVDTDVAVISLEKENGVDTFCAVVQDVTARRQADAAMQEARAAAEAASQTKSSFLANMSHELRTPMNAIIGMTLLALEDGLPPRQRDYVEKAHGAARNLLQILNDILDLSKIEAGQMELERIDFEIEAVVGEMADVLGLKADEKGLELLFSAAPNLPQRLVGDPTRLRQVLVNLGSNAIKFTERGEVTIGMELRSQDDQEVELHVWVSDTGVGLSEEQAARLFQPFVQADNSTTRRYGGTGLGLVISRQLVERMGGRLWFESRPGAGATFHFTARFGRSVPRAPSRAWMVGELRGRRALLVDDSTAALDTLTAMLDQLDVQTDRALGGQQALQQFEAAPPGSYTWVLIDWKMPGMDGVACARGILERSRGKVPHLLLVTAFGRELALRASAGLPLAGVLQKPVTPSTLYDCLLHALHGGVPPAPSPRASPVALALTGNSKRRLDGARILLVEDHPLNQELARELLERAGMQVVLAENGEDALQRLADDGPFDGVLMDCQMPVMDGYTTTQKLRENPQWHDLPVIAMTASALAEDRERALASGMNAHITKPLNVELMLQTMAQWIRADLNAAPETAEDDSRWPPPGAAASIDTSDGLSRCLGKPGLYRRLLHGFRHAQGRFAEQLRAALGEGRVDDARRLVHDLKGLAGTIGAIALQHAAADLQQALASPQRDTIANRTFAELEQVLRDVDTLLALE